MLCNFIPHETVIFDDKDPPWMSKEIKKFIHEKKNIFNCFRRSSNDKQLLDRSSDPINFLIEKSKGKYYLPTTSKLSDIGKSSKTHWFILKDSLWAKETPMYSIIIRKQWIYQRFQEKSRNIQLTFWKAALLN